jgi:hypothetical protein
MVIHDSFGTTFSKNVTKRCAVWRLRRARRGEFSPRTGHAKCLHLFPTSARRQSDATVEKVQRVLRFALIYTLTAAPARDLPARHPH